MIIRKITSLTLLLSFIPLLVTSLVLYVVPEGRVAYWSDWRWLALSKTQWGDIHITLGFLFLAAGLLHLYYNWKAVLAYLKNRAREFRLFTPAMTAALMINLTFIIGTLLYLPPFVSILDFGRAFKEAAAVKYGEPPYGHAELSSLTLFAKRTGMDVAVMKEGMTRAGLRFDSDSQTLLDIAKANGKTPKAVFDAMSGANGQEKSAGQPFPSEPFPGMGRLTLEDLCSRYGLDQQRILTALAAKNIKAKPGQTLKEIAAEHGTDPHSLFALIHEAAGQ